jgi:hypothetical protein
LADLLAVLVVGVLGERGLLGTGFGMVLGAGVERVEADAVVGGDLLVVGAGVGSGVSGRALGWAWRVIR